MKNIRMKIGVFALLTFFMLYTPGLVTAADIPTFEKPILVTCTGQTPGSLTLATLMSRAGIRVTHDPMILPSKMTGYKTLIVVMGASLKGLGAAGIDMDEEMERDGIIFKKARDSGMKIIVAHIEGKARRNEIADKFIVPFVPLGNLLLVYEEGNKDGLFTALSAKNKIPLIVFKDFGPDFTTLLKTMFP